MFRSIALPSAVLVAAGIVLTVPAAAQMRESVTISTHGLNLPSAAGRAELNARIAHAVTQVCGSLHTRSTAELQNRLACAQTARVEAKAQAERAIADAESRARMASQMPGPVAH